MNKGINMKRILSLIIAVLTVSALLCGCSKSAEGVPSGMKKASSDDADYVMYVPEDWRVDKSTLYTAAYYSSGDATSISATAYGMNYDDTTVDDWFAGFMEEFKSVYTDVSEAQSEEAKLGGIDGMKYIFSGTLNGQIYDYIITAAIRQNYIYYITYTSTPEFYEKHLDSLEDVIVNFSFK